MIAALARGAQVFDEPAYAKAALRAMDFIIQSMQTKEGRLLHRYRDGHAAIEANIDDYSFMIWALLELYEATFQTQHLSKALEYQSRLFDGFRDDKEGGFFFTPDDAEELLTRPKELYDGAIPSGNSDSLYQCHTFVPDNRQARYGRCSARNLQSFSHTGGCHADGLYAISVRP